MSIQQLFRRAGRGGGGPGGFGGAQVEPGRFTVTLMVGDKEVSLPFEVTRTGTS